MAGFDPNQPRDEEGKWTKAGRAARKAVGLITFSRDEEVTTEKSLRLVEDAYTRIPENERLKSAAVNRRSIRGGRGRLDGDIHEEGGIAQCFISLILMPSLHR